MSRRRSLPKIVPAKRVSVRSGRPENLVPLATFFLDGERVVAQWENDRYRFEVEGKGILTVVAGKPGWVKPSMGREFYDALEQAYSRSTLMVVTLTQISRPAPDEG
jgi:hypothetical protein